MPSSSNRGGASARTFTSAKKDFDEQHRTAPTAKCIVPVNEGLGIWELDREMKNLQATLSSVQEQIIEGKTVTLPF